MVSIKPGAKLEGVSSEIAFAMLIIEHTFRELGVDLVVTEIIGGRHKIGSLHFKGRAVDLRINHVFDSVAEKVRKALKHNLGDEFDVVLERKSDGTVSHLHVEFDPKVKEK